jgi:hypothetical protein
MSLADRIARSLFVALAVGLGWGIRGDFGHVVGAMYPGAALGLAFAYVSGQRSLFRWMPILAGLSALAIGVGGTMSYGILHGYAQSDTLRNYSYGFLTLFLQGSAWGTFGGALIGLMLERKPMRTGEWLGWLGSIFIGGWLTAFLVTVVFAFDINPPRNNSSIAFMGAALAQLIWLATNDKPTGLRGGLLGYIGFGLGMAVGRLLGNIANVLQGQLDFTINHWNVMEVSVGLIGGFVFTFGMVDRAYPEPPEKENIPLASLYGIVFVLGLIPLWHFLARIRPDEKLVEWAAKMKEYGYADPDMMARAVLGRLEGVCMLAFVGVVLWLSIHFSRAQRFAALPVLWLSLTMILFQNFNALYFYYPIRPKLVNMHTVFWALLGLMMVYAVFVRPRGAIGPEGAGVEAEARVPLVRWTAATVAVLALAIFIAGFVNGETTMTSANTRWPVWVWRDGPFPREAAAP